MSREYGARRCSKRWLDADCPAEVLCIMDHPKEVDRYTIFYVDVDTVRYEGTSYTEKWLTFLSVTESGNFYHGEMKAHEVAQYRYRQKHRYAKWSALPLVVKMAVWQDIEAASQFARSLEEK